MKNKKMIWIGVAVLAIVVYFVFFKKKDTDTTKE